MSIETMKLALDALEIVTREMLTLRDELAERGGRPKANVVHQRLWDSSFKVYTDTADTTAESLRQAIAEAEQAKPMLWISIEKETRMLSWGSTHPGYGDYWVPLYTTPLQRKPLTDEEIGKILERGDLAERDAKNGWWHVLPYSFARAIEAKLKEKNT